LALAAPWWWLSWRVLGNPLGLAWEQQKDWAAKSGWAGVVLGRGWDYYLRVLLHSPGMLVGLGAGIVAVVRRQRVLAYASVFAWLCLMAAQVHSGGKEARHLLHVYPALALLAGWGVIRGRRAFGRVRDVVVVVGLVGLLAWEAREGLSAAFDVVSVPQDY
jgi:hypothetical protein